MVSKRPSKLGEMMKKSKRGEIESRIELERKRERESCRSTSYYDGPPP